jgi:hypothetical protein
MGRTALVKSRYRIYPAQKFIEVASALQCPDNIVIRRNSD